MKTQDQTLDPLNTYLALTTRQQRLLCLTALLAKFGSYNVGHSYQRNAGSNIHITETEFI